MFGTRTKKKNIPTKYSTFFGSASKALGFLFFIKLLQKNILLFMRITNYLCEWLLVRVRVYI